MRKSARAEKIASFSSCSPAWRTRNGPERSKSCAEGTVERSCRLLLALSIVSSSSTRMVSSPLSRETPGRVTREMAGYDVLLTVDQGIPHQQHSASRKLSIILVRSRTNQIEDLLPFVHAILNALKTITPGQIVPIP